MNRWIRSLLLAPLLVTCTGDPTGPEQVQDGALTFLQFDETALPLVTFEARFWAVAGRNSELIMRYQPENGQQEGDRFLEFRIPGNGLLRRPDGTAFVQGDSIEIRVAVDSAGRFVFDFQPSGLRFNPDHPAELRVEYRRANPDLNGDGRVDGKDAEVEDRLSIWRQEGPGQPWIRQGTLRIKDNDEVRAQITGFTGFAVAS